MVLRPEQNHHRYEYPCPDSANRLAERHNQPFPRTSERVVAPFPDRRAARSHHGWASDNNRRALLVSYQPSRHEYPASTRHHTSNTRMSTALPHQDETKQMYLIPM